MSRTSDESSSICDLVRKADDPAPSGHPGKVRIHLDTDLGGDTDDACALAMLLGWPDVEITGITTVADPGGRRAACVAHLLRLAGRDDIPLAAGAEVSATTLARWHAPWRWGGREQR
jgi:Inosine-uridine preferring nucleoside hydrolase